MRVLKVYKSHFWDFYKTLSKETQDKLDYVLALLIELDRIPKIYYKHITKGIYTIRVRNGFVAIRIFSFSEQAKIIVLLHGIKKKTQKLPRREIDKAIRLRNEYYEDINSGNH